MEKLQFFEYTDSFTIFSEQGYNLGELRKRQGNWCLQANANFFITEAELLSIMVKLSQLNKNTRVIFIGE